MQCLLDPGQCPPVPGQCLTILGVAPCRVPLTLGTVLLSWEWPYALSPCPREMALYRCPPVLGVVLYSVPLSLGSVPLSRVPWVGGCTRSAARVPQGAPVSRERRRLRPGTRTGNGPRTRTGNGPGTGHQGQPLPLVAPRSRPPQACAARRHPAVL